MKVTHLVVFLPPALGAYVLSQHRSKVSSSLSAADAAPTQDEPHTLRVNQSSFLTPPAIVHHQVEQIANAGRSAAQDSLEPYTKKRLESHTLLADTQTRSSKNLVPWSLKFTLRPQWRVFRQFFFFPALPSEHGAWSVNSREMRLQKG